MQHVSVCISSTHPFYEAAESCARLINSTAQADSPKKHRLLNLHLSRSIAPAPSQHRCYLGHNIVLFCLYTFICISLVNRVLHFLKDFSEANPTQCTSIKTWKHISKVYFKNAFQPHENQWCWRQTWYDKSWQIRFDTHKAIVLYVHRNFAI